MAAQHLEFTPKDFHRCTFQSLDYKSCIHHQQQYYAPQPYGAHNTVQLITPLTGRPTLLAVGTTGVIQKLDSHGAPHIQFPGNLLNCLPVDLPCLRKLPTPSVWMIRGLAPNSTSPHKLNGLASPKYRDSTTQSATDHSQEFDIEDLRSTLAEPPLTPWDSIPMPETEDFAPDTLCLSVFTPGS